MKHFFGAFFGSVLGILLSTVVAVFLIVALITSGIKDAVKDAKGGGPYTSKGNSILNLTFSGVVVDREKSEIERMFSKLKPGGGDEGMGLNMIMNNLEKAKSDTAIKGVYLKFEGLMAGKSAIQDIRKAILDFKKSGKFVYAYSENYSQSEYYIASSADKVFLNPQGGMDWKGLSMTLMFFKKSFEKLGLDVEIYRHGKFKSAIEPFMLDKMSEANRLQAETFLNSIWNNMLVDIAKSRKSDVATLNKLANDLSVTFPQEALSYKLVDALAYQDEVMTELKTKLKLKEKDKINFVSHESYIKFKPKGAYVGKDKITVIYAVGSINSGEGSDEEIGSDRIAKAIKEARLDENTKAIVLRVNSPGGSALASDVIWREVVLTKAIKPIVVSMGDVAASGGYYIACAADKIYAQPNTITGSIGVFGIVPFTGDMFKNKLGITFDHVTTNDHAVLSTNRKLTDSELLIFQEGVDDIYNDFISKVAEGRGITKAEVDSIGQGRVWAGTDAIKIGLVDEFGGIYSAINFAAEKAGIAPADIKLKFYPIQKEDGLFEILDNIENMDQASFARNEIEAQMLEIYSYIKTIATTNSIQARLPYLFWIN